MDCRGKRAFLQHSISHHLYVPHEVQQIPSRQVTDKPESLSINLITSQQPVTTNNSLLCSAVTFVPSGLDPQTLMRQRWHLTWTDLLMTLANRILFLITSSKWLSCQRGIIFIRDFIRLIKCFFFFQWQNPLLWGHQRKVFHHRIQSYSQATFSQIFVRHFKNH